MATLSSEDVKSILVHWDYDPNKSRVFYATLRALLDDPTHPAWDDEEIVVWVVDRGWRGDYHYVAQSWCRKIGNFGKNLDIIMRHRKAVDVVIDVMATSNTIWIIDRMATFLANMQKLDASFFTDDDCSWLAAAIGRLDDNRSSHAKIIRRIQRVCNGILHPKHQNFEDIEAMFASSAPL
jgi:hypothetical protein